MKSDTAVPLSLYLKLEQGQFADLEVVSRASIEIIGAIRDLAAFVDPTAQVKITIQSGTEGSLRLNSVVEFLTGRAMSPDEEKRAKRRATAIGLIVCGSWWLLDGVGSHYLSKALDALDAKVVEWVQEEELDEDPDALLKECKDLLTGAARNKVGEAHIRRFYETIEKDPVIVGVGISDKHDAIPSSIVPREQFSVRARPPEDVKEREKRTRKERMEMLVVQLRLLADNRAWRFAANGVEFAARVLDRNFVEDALSGRSRIQILEGLIMDADVDIDEESQDGAWIIKSRSVVKVHKVSPQPKQGSFFDPVEPYDENANDDH